LPYGLKLQQNIKEYLGWYPAHPEYFRNDRAIERATSGEVDMLRHVGTPDWVIRTMPRLSQSSAERESCYSPVASVDRDGILFTSALGTKRTRSRISPRSGVEGRPEVVAAVQNDGIDPS